MVLFSSVMAASSRTLLSASSVGRLVHSSQLGCLSRAYVVGSLSLPLPNKVLGAARPAQTRAGHVESFAVPPTQWKLLHGAAGSTMGVRSLSTNSEGGSKKKGAAKGASTSGRGKKEKDSKITEAELVGADVVENKKEKKPKSTKAKKEEKGDEVPVPPMGRVDSAALLKLESDDQDFERKSSQKKWPHKIISIRRTAKITKAGVLNSFSAFLIVGNKKGLIGYGKGKSNEAKKAVERAYQNAMNNLIAIELFEGHTIYHDVEHRFKKTKVNLWAEKQGSGVIANELVSTICDLAGIQNLRAKVHGVHHKRNTVRAIFEALELVESVEEMRRARGADLRLY